MRLLHAPGVFRARGDLRRDLGTRKTEMSADNMVETTNWRDKKVCPMSHVIPLGPAARMLTTRELPTRLFGVNYSGAVHCFAEPDEDGVEESPFEEPPRSTGALSMTRIMAA